MKDKIQKINEISLNVLDSLSKYLSDYKIEVTTNDFDLKYSADLKVTTPDGRIEYWLMRFRHLPYTDFTLRTQSYNYPSEYDKIYNGNTISSRYLYMILDKKDLLKKLYIVNIKRLTQSKQLLDFVYQNQHIRTNNPFVYITEKQLLDNNCIDVYLNYEEMKR